MSLNRRNPRRDGNEREVIQMLEAQGFCVMQISGKGIPDLLVSQPAHAKPWPRMWLVEVKQPKGRMRPAQVAFREKWRGPAPITLWSVSDAEKFMLLACEGGK